tara:strand:- start:274 stop:627 length:354 start_codon:yes stop_codon:yes gene_type:complete
MNVSEVFRRVYIEDLFDVKSRASRLEYWLGAQLIGIVFLIPSYIIGDIGFVFDLWGLIAAVTCGIRRLHDIDKSGWNLLWTLTVIGAFYVLYLYVQPSQQESNQYGSPRPHTVVLDE